MRLYKSMVDMDLSKIFSRKIFKRFKIVYNWEGTTQIQKLALARNILK